MTPWQAILDRRKANIGFATKVGGLRPPTPAEKNIALSIEMAAWQLSQSKKTWHLNGSEYSTPIGPGINLLRTREPGGKLNGPEYNKAIDAYVHTPMDHHGILKAQGIDVSRWEIKQTIFHKIIYKLIDWYRLKKNDEYEPPNRTRLTEEFIEMFSIKEKK